VPSAFSCCVQGYCAAPSTLDNAGSEIRFCSCRSGTATGYVPIRFTPSLSFHHSSFTCCFVIHRRHIILAVDVDVKHFGALQIPGPGRLGPRHFGVAPSILPSIYFYIMCSCRFSKTPAHFAHRDVSVVTLNEWWVFLFAVRNFRRTLIGSVFCGLPRVDGN